MNTPIGNASYWYGRYRFESCPDYMNITGDIAELKFMVLFRQKGYIVSKPMSHHSRYDFIIDSGNEMKRVQVKSTSSLLKDKNCYMCHSYTQKSKIRYSSFDIDFVAMYVDPYDAWYMIPIESISSENIKVYPHRAYLRSKYEKYRIQ